MPASYDFCKKSIEMKQYFTQAYVIIGILWSGSALAQVNGSDLPASQLSDTSAIPLSEVIITENRMQLPFAKQNRNIQIIDRQQIDAMPARSINELLRRNRQPLFAGWR